MTRSEAAELLGVAEDAPAGDVRRRYEALLTDYQIRLTNAPTPALKKTYQQKLQDLMAAGDVLHPGLTSGPAGSDLPSPEPLIDSVSGAGAATLGLRTRRVAEPSVTSRTSAGGEDAGLPRSTLFAAAGAVVLAAVLSFVILRLVQVSSQAAALETERDRLAAGTAALEARVAANDRFLHRDRLRVRNLSQQTVKISAAAFVYRDDEGAMKMQHSGNFGYPTWEIRPGGVAQLDAEMGRGRMWDGAVVYYSFLVEYPGMEPFLKTGLWADDIDRLDKVVTLDLD
jgi:hypothetical protein